MTDAGDFIDAALRYEGSDERAARERDGRASGLRFYGASVGAVRGTVRDARRRYPDLTRDALTALCSELWAEPVFERRFAAVVLLQSMLAHLDNTDLTRIEGFLRQSDHPGLVGPLTDDVAAPLIAALDGSGRAKADAIVTRWSADENPTLRKAADDLLRRTHP